VSIASLDCWSCGLAVFGLGVGCVDCWCTLSLEDGGFDFLKAWVAFWLWLVLVAVVDWGVFLLGLGVGGWGVCFWGCWFEGRYRSCLCGGLCRGVFWFRLCEVCGGLVLGVGYS